MSNLVDKAIELQVMTCLDSLLDRANHDEYLQRIGKKEALRFLEENSQYVEIIKSRLHRLESIENAEPSEALKCLEEMANYRIEYSEYSMPIKDTSEFKAIEQALIKAKKEHNSLNLLMQELDCKDFADLRKYARCGYEKFNKQYLKFDDLDFPYGVWKNAKVVLNGEKLGIRYKSDYGFMDCDYKVVKIFNLKTGKCICKIYDKDKDFFNNLHLQFEKECSNCKKQHTKDCPNSSECYSKKDKPYWERVEE